MSKRTEKNEKTEGKLKPIWERVPGLAKAVLIYSIVGATVLFGFLWIAQAIGVNEDLLEFLDVTLWPAVVATVFLWFVSKYDKEISDILKRVKRIGPAGLEMSESSESIQRDDSKAATVAPPASSEPTKEVVEGDQEKAKTDNIEEIRKKAREGDAAAQVALGWMYDKGEGVEQNDIKAAEWYRRAAEQGVAVAQNNLGTMYQYGRGVEQNDNEAAEWYRRAADQGVAVAQNNLGGMYSDGRGVEQNDNEAVKWYRLAAEQECAFAQHNLGGMYRGGRGVEQNDKEAVKWYQRAAEQGVADAQFNLGVMYGDGRGVEQDDIKAMEWYQCAAGQGLDSAQHNLGVMYTKGQGVPQNYREAYIWFSMATANGRKNSEKSRDSLAKQLSYEDLTEAQKEATQRSEEIRKRVSNE